MLTPSYILGLTFILLVAIIWALASILVQHIYRDLKFESPFILTYICTSLFTVLLPTRLLWERVIQNVLYEREKVVIIPYESGPLPTGPSYLPIIKAGDSNDTTEDESDDVNENIEIRTYNTTTAQLPPSSSDLSSTSPDKKNTSRSEQQQQQQQLPEVYHDASPPSITIKSNETINENDNHVENGDDDDDDDDRIPPSSRSFILGHRETFGISLKIAPLWFVGNYAYNLSLEYTSITASTVLASTGSLFTFVFALLCRDERFGCAKLTGVLLCILGSVLTCLGDDGEDESDDDDDGGGGSSGGGSLVGSTTWGDIAGLIAAVGYGAYTVLIRISCPKDESQISMQLLFGYIGLINAVCLSPFVIYDLIKTSGGGLTWVILFWLVVKGLVDNVLSDYLWARAVVLTNATVATVGLALTIPLAFLSDFIIGGIRPNGETVAGAMAVLMGFVLVNVGQC